jgi:hypothetical protein
MFPPGRARLATNPFLTGSVSCVMTMAIVTVASLAERVAPEPAVTMTSTLRRTNWAARSLTRSGFPSPYRHSMTMFFPSSYPSSRRPYRNASARIFGKLPRGLSLRYPIRGTLADCCASAAKHSAKSKAQVAKPRTLVFLLMPIASCLLPVFSRGRDRPCERPPARIRT